MGTGTWGIAAVIPKYLSLRLLWLTRQQLADLFGRDYKTISKHINNALKEELADEVVVAKFANTSRHGAMKDKTQTHDKEYFNLEMVTSVGYRVKSKRGVQFRITACLSPCDVDYLPPADKIQELPDETDNK